LEESLAKNFKLVLPEIRQQNQFEVLFGSFSFKKKNDAFLKESLAKNFKLVLPADWQANAA